MSTLGSKTGIAGKQWRACETTFFYGISLCVALILLSAITLTSAAQSPQANPSVPSTPSAPWSDARKMLEAGHYEDADHALRAVLLQAPDAADAHFLLGFALLHEQKPAESLAAYMQGAKFREPGSDELVGISLDYIHLKDDLNAEHWLLLAAKSAPERALTWYLLGRTQYNQRHWADAERSLLTCLKVDPHHLRAAYNLGLVEEMLGRSQNAETYYRMAITWQEPALTKDLQPYLYLGVLLRKQGKTEEALPFLVTATGGFPRDSLAHQELGLAYEQLGRYNEAAQELRTAISLAPENKTLHFFLGRVDRKAGFEEAAVREFALATSHSDSSPTKR